MISSLRVLSISTAVATLPVTVTVSVSGTANADPLHTGETTVWTHATNFGGCVT